MSVHRLPALPRLKSPPRGRHRRSSLQSPEPAGGMAQTPSRRVSIRLAAGGLRAEPGADQNGNGHRRLNVLFTRAKQRIDLFSSMSANDIRIDGASSRGLQTLQGYLSFAATLNLEPGSFNEREPDSHFEVFVADSSRGSAIVD